MDRHVTRLISVPILFYFLILTYFAANYGNICFLLRSSKEDFFLSGTGYSFRGRIGVRIRCWIHQFSCNFAMGVNSASNFRFCKFNKKQIENENFQL